MKYIIPGLREKYNIPNIKSLNLSIDDVLKLPNISNDSTLIGFSIGAIIAYLISLKQPIKHLVICSPSPIITKYVKPKSKITIIVGAKEHKSQISNAKILAKKWGVELNYVYSGHKMTNNYIKKIKELI